MVVVVVVVVLVVGGVPNRCGLLIPDVMGLVTMGCGGGWGG